MVEDAPDGDIPKTEFDAVLAQQAAQQGVKKVPSPSDPQYSALLESTMADLLLGRWVRGEASERGITISDSEVSNRLDQIIDQEFGGQKQFEQFLKQAQFTEEEASQRVEVQLLSDEIQQEVLPQDASVSDSEIEDFYNANIEQFQQPETRDVRQILNKDQAKVEQAKALLEEDDSPASWKKVAARFSTEDATKDVGGLVEGVTEGESEPALAEQIFSAAEGELVGPFKGGDGLLPDPGREDHPGRDDAARAKSPSRSASSSLRGSSSRPPRTSSWTSSRSGRRGASAPMTT